MGISMRPRQLFPEIGALSFLYMMRDFRQNVIIHPLIYGGIPNVKGNVQETEHLRDDYALKACYVGVGRFGGYLARHLHRTSANRTVSGPVNPQMQSCEFKRDFAEIASFLKNQDLVFLTGSFEDQTFWLIRDLVLSIVPSLVITIGILKSHDHEMALNPSPKECFIPLIESASLDKLAQLILQFHCSVTGIGYICVSFEDYRYVLSGSLMTPLTYESTTRDDAEESFGRFLEQNEGIIRSSEKLVCTMFMEDVPMEEFDARMRALIKLLDDDAQVIVHDIQDLHLFQPELRFKMQLFVASEPDGYVYGGWPYFRI